MDLHFSKKALIAALEARKSWAKALDKKAAIKHKKEETRALAIFHAKLKVALKWDYKKAKESRYSYLTLDGVECPKSMTSQLEQALKWITTDGTTRYTITSAGHMRNVHYLLTHDENLKPDVC